jgi:predicted secreted protein
MPTMKELASNLADCGSKMPGSKWPLLPRKFNSKRVVMLISAVACAILLNCFYSQLSPFVRIFSLPAVFCLVWLVSGRFTSDE